MKKIISMTLISLTAVGLLMSCASTVDKPTDTGVDVISVEPDVMETSDSLELTEDGKGGWLNALGSIEGLNVKGFRLRGEGPDGASFGWIDVKSTKVALSDIRRGEWELFAEAIGENGEVVATGSLKTFLSDKTPLGTLFLSEENGYGNVTCDFNWTPTQVLYPSIEVYIKTEDGEFVARDSREVVMDENGHAVWTAPELPAGSYIVRAILKDEGEVVSGVAAALRVIDGKVSVGNCDFVIGKLSTVYGIDLQNAPIDTVEGKLSFADNVITFDSALGNLKYAWFLDGSLVPEFKNLSSVDLSTLGFKKGFYRIDCIASNPSGFSSINTDTVFIYSDGDGNYACVSEEQADSQKGDIPSGYTEVFTKDSPYYNAGSQDIFRVEDLGTVETLEVAMEGADNETAEAIEEILHYIPSDKALDAINLGKSEARRQNATEEELWQIVLLKLKNLVESGTLTDGHVYEEAPVEAPVMTEPTVSVVEDNVLSMDNTDLTYNKKEA